MKLHSEMRSVDLYVHEYGVENCAPGHYFGPAVREYFLFHYIFSGLGFFRTSENTYVLQEGQGFLIFPDDLNYYQADEGSPWSYGWLGVTGINAEEYFHQCGLSRKNPIWNGGKDEFIEDCLLKMDSARRLDVTRHLKLTGYAYLILSRMIEKSSRQQPRDVSNRHEAYLQAAVRYMEQNYYRNIRIAEVAETIGLDRSYLGFLFKKNLNISMQDFLADLRMNKACRLLRNADLRIADVSRSVGYSDQLQFSKVFKAHQGLSPLEYRKRCDIENDDGSSDNF
ncbi:MAG: AraC family transcriptional regulator [Thermoclostridium sp.]|nr:AraC family transcriptional regulator [Thermoclostridium sp.]